MCDLYICWCFGGWRKVGSYQEASRTSQGGSVINIFRGCHIWYTLKTFDKIFQIKTSAGKPPDWNSRTNKRMQICQVSQRMFQKKLLCEQKEMLDVIRHSWTQSRDEFRMF